MAYENEQFDKALENLQKSWLLGSPLAIGGLYEIYKNGGGEIEKDMVTAAAYLYLHESIFDAHFPDDEIGAVTKRMKVRNATILAEQMSAIKPSEVETAIRIAREFLVSNSECCIDW